MRLRQASPKPEAVSQGRRAPDIGLRPQKKPLSLTLARARPHHSQSDIITPMPMRLFLWL